MAIGHVQTLSPGPLALRDRADVAIGTEPNGPQAKFFNVVVTMPIQSKSELRVALAREIPWLPPTQIDESIAKSCFKSGRLVALYAKFVRNSPAQELAAFLNVAGAYLAGVGGDPNGLPVQKDRYPSESGCRPQQDYWYWAADSGKSGPRGTQKIGPMNRLTSPSPRTHDVQSGSTCDVPGGSVALDEEYVRVNTPILREQVAKAGVRLAHMLEKAFQ
jgi:hypothetical protein